MTEPDVPEEWVDHIDEHDRVIGRVPRRLMRRDNLLHRSVGILCFDPAGLIYVHRRTDTKDVFPGLHDMTVGGVVSAGESYDDAAVRELAEELGISGPTPEFLFKHRYEDAFVRSLAAVYRVVWDGPIRHQPSEVAWGGYFPVADIASNARGFRFVPDGWQLFTRYLALKGE